MRLRKIRSVEGHERGDAGADERRRREGRGLGPFSGGQLTIIVVAVVVMVGLPVGAFAVATTKVAVADLATGKTAAVTSTRQLQVHPNGVQTVSGSVTATEASPKRAFNSEAVASSSAFSPMAAPPTGYALVVNTITIDTYFLNAPGIGRDFFFRVSAADASCASTAGPQVADVNPGGIGEISIPVQGAIVIPAGRALCAGNGDNVNVGAEIYTYGYLVPAASALSGLAVTQNSNASPVQGRPDNP